MALNCPHCDVQLEDGTALIPEDFFQKASRCFFSAFSCGETVDVKKCPKCGHSDYEPPAREEGLPSHEEYRVIRFDNKQSEDERRKQCMQDEITEGIKRITKNIRKGNQISPCYVQTETQREFIIKHFKEAGWDIEFWTENAVHIKPLEK